MKTYSRIGILFIVLFVVGSGLAQPPKLINFQGKLINKDGLPVSGSKYMRFSIYGDTLKKAFWSDVMAVNIRNGVYNVLLGNGLMPIADSLFSNKGQLFLGLKVEPDPEMTKILLTSVPFSIQSLHTSTHYDVVFSVYIKDNTGLSDSQSPLKFEAISNNVGGFYNIATSIFTVPYKGTYLFTMTGVGANLGTNGLDWNLMVNKTSANSIGLNIGESVECARLSFVQNNITTSRSIIVRLNKGDQVSIQQSGTGRCDNFRSSWEGALLYADVE